MNYQLNPLLEGWKGTTAAATAGLIGGAISHEIGVANKTRKDYNNYLSTVGNIRLEIRKTVARLKEEISYITRNIEEWNDTLKLGVEADNLDLEELEWWKTELKEKQEELATLRALIKKNDINELREYLKKVDYESAKFQSLRKVHERNSKTSAWMKPVGGAIGAGLGYHYLSKGINALKPKALKLLKRAK